MASRCSARKPFYAVCASSDHQTGLPLGVRRRLRWRGQCKQYRTSAPSTPTPSPASRVHPRRPHSLIVKRLLMASAQGAYSLFLFVIHELFTNTNNNMERRKGGVKAWAQCRWCDKWRRVPMLLEYCDEFHCADCTRQEDPMARDEEVCRQAPPCPHWRAGSSAQSSGRPGPCAIPRD